MNKKVDEMTPEERKVFLRRTFDYEKDAREAGCVNPFYFDCYNCGKRFWSERRDIAKEGAPVCPICGSKGEDDGGEI